MSSFDVPLCQSNITIMPGPTEKGLNGWMAAYSKSSLIIIKDTAQLNLKDEVFVQVHFT